MRFLPLKGQTYVSALKLNSYIKKKNGINKI